LVENKIYLIRNEKQIYAKALKMWGKESQINVAIEELAELITVLAKRNRKINGKNNDEICEEIADVEIVLNQLKMIYDSEKIKNIKYKKLERFLFKYMGGLLK
jgi:hypothetical protein